MPKNRFSALRLGLVSAAREAAGLLLLFVPMSSVAQAGEPPPVAAPGVGPGYLSGGAACRAGGDGRRVLGADGNDGATVSVASDGTLIGALDRLGFVSVGPAVKGQLE